MSTADPVGIECTAIASQCDASSVASRLSCRIPIAIVLAFGVVAAKNGGPTFSDLGQYRRSVGRHLSRPERPRQVLIHFNFQNTTS